jgi:hypothetical protein
MHASSEQLPGHCADDRPRPHKLGAARPSAHNAPSPDCLAQPTVAGRRVAAQGCNGSCKQEGPVVVLFGLSK